MKQFILALLFLAFSGIAHSAPILLVTDGQLLGANGVDVDGVLYDVQFVEGSCFDLFNGCDEPGDFDFTDADSAARASLALLDQVLINTAFGLFDDFSELTFGCEDVDTLAEFACSIFTVYNSGDGAIGFAAHAVNRPASSTMPDQVFLGTYNLTFDTTPDEFPGNRAVLADWSLSNPVAVPEPRTLLLFGLGLLALWRGVREINPRHHPCVSKQE